MLIPGYLSLFMFHSYKRLSIATSGHKLISPSLAVWVLCSVILVRSKVWSDLMIAFLLVVSTLPFSLGFLVHAVRSCCGVVHLVL